MFSNGEGGSVAVFETFFQPTVAPSAGRTANLRKRFETTTARHDSDKEDMEGLEV